MAQHSGEAQSNGGGWGAEICRNRGEIRQIQKMVDIGRAGTKLGRNNSDRA